MGKTKTFYTNKGCFSEDQISIEINDEHTEISTGHYINIVNIVEESSGIKPSSFGDTANPLLDETTVAKIIDTYRNHPSVITTC